MNRRGFLGSTFWGLARGSGLGKATSPGSRSSGQAAGSGSIELSPEHLAAVNRRRRVAQNFDVLLVDPDTYPSVDAVVKSRFTFIDDPDSAIDSVWWNWSEGNVVPYPSKFLPNFNQPGFQKWLEEGVDIVRIFQDETRKRGLEVFFSHRMNGSDNDPQHILEVTSPPPEGGGFDLRLKSPKDLASDAGDSLDRLSHSARRPLP